MGIIYFIKKKIKMCPIMNFLFGLTESTGYVQQTHNFFGMPYQPKFEQPQHSMMTVISLKGPVQAFMIFFQVIFATYMTIAQELANQAIDFITTYQFELGTGLYDVAASSLNLTSGFLMSSFLGKVAFKPLKPSDELDFEAISAYMAKAPAFPAFPL